MLLIFFSIHVNAEVFYAQDEALRLAFPEATSVEKKTFVLTDEEHRLIQETAKTKVESKVFAFYVAKKGQETLGYAAIDSHIVRTMYETFMVVLTPQGAVKKVVILAFYEPPEYITSDKWLKQFENKRLPEESRLNDTIQGIAGSTLSSQAVTDGVNKILAIFQQQIGQK